MVGVYADAAGAPHAFVHDRHGYTTFDAPGVTLTLPFGLNNRGQIAGIAGEDTTQVAGLPGFVLRRGVGGPFTTVAFPASAGTLATDINDASVVVGPYANPDGGSPQPMAGRFASSKGASR